MKRKTLLGAAMLIALLPSVLPTVAHATVTRVSLVEDFGFFT